MPDFLLPAPERIDQFARHVRYAGRVLDVGTGSGVLARLALERGAHDVTAIDINPAAVEHTRRTVPGVTVVLSDLFENVTGAFDTITFAAPWSVGEIRRDYDHALFDCGVVERFFSEVRPRLTDAGTIWLQYCDAYPENFARLPGWISGNGFSVRAQWSYETWGQLVRRRVNTFLYEIG